MKNTELEAKIEHLQEKKNMLALDIDELQQ